MKKFLVVGITVGFLIGIASAATPPSTRNGMLVLPTADESAFPLPDGGNVGSLMFGTDAGKLYVNSGSLWVPDTCTGASCVLTGTISASNLSGTNTGDITIGTFGSSPTAKGASLSSQVLTLQPADSSNPGLVSTSAQTFTGVKTFSSAITSGDTWHVVGSGGGEPAFTNSWSNFGSGYQSFRFKKLVDGFVRLEGVLLSPNPATASIFTLPAGYRPATIAYAICSHGVAVNPCTIEIATAGTMVVYGVTNNQGVTIMLDFALD